MGGHDSHGHGHVQKVSIPEEEIRKILAKAKYQFPSEAPKYPHSTTSGVVHTSIEGRFENERSRLGPSFSESDRQWRVKYLESQNLHPSEPFEVPQLKDVHRNIFRRIYQYPMDQVEKVFQNYMPKHVARITRSVIGGGFVIYLFSLFALYQVTYNSPNWEYAGGPRIHHTRESVMPGDIRWPMPNPRTESWQHYDRGFHDRKVFNEFK